MNTSDSIKAFSQSEKLKAGLIWASQIAEACAALAESDKAGAEKILKILVGMIASEIHVAQKAAPNDLWSEAEKDVHTAQVMLNSGAGHDVAYHLTQALSKITTVGQQSMSRLVEEKLL
jgi:hypothetical protein